MTGLEIWNLYMTLTDVEDGFRSMKSELGLRPNHHQLDKRIKGSIVISVLVQQRVTTEMTRREGKGIWLRGTSAPEAFHYLVADALSIKAKPLDTKRRIR